MGSTTERSLKWRISTILTLAVAGLSYLAWETSWRGRLTTAWGALQELRNLPQGQIDDFFAAYDRLKIMPTGMPADADKKAIHDYVRI